ncbi:MAG: class I SAM-dependent methyltransferase [Chthoniobacterales bacterium]|jgi:16S rRNA C1402 N4-methylase RsmH
MSSITLEISQVRLTRVAANWITASLPEGGFAVDATVGNGYDTLFLADRVGKNGRVLGFDVQKMALNNASELIRFAGNLDRVRLVLGCHSGLARALMGYPRVDAAMFNLGYLPRGDRRIVTRPSTTIPAIAALVERLAPNGRISIIAYRGHPEGPEEYQAVRDFLEQRTELDVRELTGDPENETGPRLFLVKLKGP